MGELVGHDRGQLRRVARARDEPRVDVDVAPRPGEGVHVFVHDDVPGDREGLGPGRGRETGADAPHVGDDGGIAHEALLALDLPRELIAQPALLIHRERAASAERREEREGGRAAREQSHG